MEETDRRIERVIVHQETEEEGETEREREKRDAGIELDQRQLVPG